MNYARKSFTVAAPMSDAYAEGWERTFGKGGARDSGPVQQQAEVVLEVSLATLQDWASTLALGHPEASAAVRDAILDLVGEP